MTKDEVMLELSKFGNEQTKKVLTRHGAREPFYGVKVGDLKTLVKKIKKDHGLALELYKTGNSDAMYLAGLIADEKRVTRKELQDWVKGAYWYMLSEYTVPWLAAESRYGWELALEWIESTEEGIASAGWSTLSSLVSLRPDEELDQDRLSQLLDHVARHIHPSQNRVRYTMNGFVIAVGSYVSALTDKANEVAATIGKVSVDMGGTACKVPLAMAYIRKMEDKGYIGMKRKSARC
ncbi:MAG: DNA alkylation repair protein [Bacteroides sp. SM1_62]|nr:MAG: DNA alkylation repair protein [Bacteroides sp. SM23_62]KPL25564.1 MAG: DNA alkylation repair protein [Bacteroides sp. SM1_62]